ncbi:GAF domain-containing SpoIIE family protein phosphatase [Streptomyces sp. NRRL S-340]|uniref:GAF domain-containing SpoIIE family protein phosphatase n=1 Tax=Streptomyces sp. NRRL S-340 TaxID=1463901 RepID=UPI00069249C9|nr:GAF domain-containing SpoIIE family protein phosphatase [Streptomyces sp. NRRL S-340]
MCDDSASNGVPDGKGSAAAAARQGLQELGVCLSGVVSGLGAYGGGVYLLDPAGDALVLSVYTGLPPQFAGPWRRIRLDAPVGAAEAARERKLVWVADAQEMARRYPRTALLLPYRLAFACLPVSAAGAVHGTLFVNWAGSRPQRLERTERDRLEAAASALGRVLAHAAGTGLPVRPASEPLVLPGPAPATGGLLEGSALARLPEGVCVLGVDGRVLLATPAAAALLDASRDDLVGRVLWRALPWLDHPVYEERYRAAAMSRQPTAFTVLCPPDRWLCFQLYPDASGITVRITDAGPDPRPAGPPHAAVPIHRPGGTPAPARLDGVYHVLHLVGALANATGVRDVVRLVAEEMLPVFGAARAVLLALEGDGRLRVIGAHGYPSDVLGRIDRPPAGAETPGTRALATGAPLFLESRHEMARLYPRHAALGHGCAWAVLPLLAADRDVGACVLAYDRPRRFLPEERATLTALAGLIAQALARARRYDDASGLARDLQDALLPRRLPRIHGLETAVRYLPAAEGMSVGGDFYDLIALGHHRAAAVIGDIQGHNGPAAALMGQIRTAVRAHAASGADPRRVLALTNRLLTALDTELLASAVYLRLDPRRHRVLLARAGHPHPLLRHPDGRVEALDLPGGLLLGIDPRAAYPHVRLCLPEGAVLALYTDGLTELPGTDPDRALATLADRLAAAGTPGAPLDEIADALLRDHRPGADDTTLLLLRATHRAPGPPPRAPGRHRRAVREQEGTAPDE